MYIPPAFQESDPDTLYRFIERYSFGTLISQVDGNPFATHLPMLLEKNDSGASLIGHTARANPQCLQIQEQTALAIFAGPHAYVSPTWYESDNVVPTWNYVAVHVYGKIQRIDDQKSLAEIVSRTTNYYEQSQPTPWVFDSSTTYAERMLPQIVGFRLKIERIEGKWKISQNHPLERQQKVIQALRKKPSEDARAIADLMESRLELPQ